MSSSESNMELFNELTVHFLAKLYEKFPVEQDIMVKDYPDYDNAQKVDVFFDTIKFLIREHYIHHNAQPYGGFIGVSLTSKGLSVLDSKPASLSKSASLVALFNDALKSGSAESYKTCVKELTNAALNLSIEKITND